MAKWTKEEEEILMKNFGNKTYKEIAKMLDGRNWMSVRNKARQLKLVGKDCRTSHPLYQSWSSMTFRFRNQVEWESYNDFYEWGIQNWQEGLVLTRINEEENYKPENCKFVSKGDIIVGNIDSEKSKQTCIQKYGVDHYTKTEEYKERVKETCLKKYGVKHHTQNEKVKAKIKETVKEKYGVDCVLSNKDIKEKIKQTNLERHGVEYPAQNPKIMAKVKKTQIEKGIAYFHEGKNSQDIADELGVSRSTANKWIRLYGYESAMKMSKNQSEIENIIQNILEKHNLSFSYGQKLGNNFTDFIIDKLVIEADGLYWHSDAINEDKSYHKKKMNNYKTEGYNSLFFREDEIQIKTDIVESIILNKLNLNNNKIYARKTIIKEIPKKEASIFFNQNHLMGQGSGKCFGLIYKNTLVCALRYINKKEYIDISRFCTTLNTTVVGGYSKLLNYLPRKNIQTFVDLRYGNGEYLTRFGFTKEKAHLSFRWVKNNKTYHRLKFKGNTGYDYGYYKLWDCGQAKYLKLIN